MRPPTGHEGLLHLHLSVGLRQGADAGPSAPDVLVRRWWRDQRATLPTRRNPTAPELSYLTAKLAALMPFGKVATVLDEVLPTTTRTHASTVRNRTLRVGQRLERHQEALIAAPPPEPADHLVLGLDGDM